MLRNCIVIFSLELGHWRGDHSASGPFLVLRQVVADLAPLGPGAHEYMAYRSYGQRRVEGPEAHGDDGRTGSFAHDRAAAIRAEFSLKSRFLVKIGFQQFMARYQFKLIGFYSRVGRECRTARFPAAFTMAVVAVADLAFDLIDDRTTKTTSTMHAFLSR